jgi:hypothetical protein
MSLLATVASTYTAGYLHSSILKNILILVSIVNSAIAIIFFILFSLLEIEASPLPALEPILHNYCRFRNRLWLELHLWSRIPLRNRDYTSTPPA